MTPGHSLIKFDSSSKKIQNIEFKFANLLMTMKDDMKFSANIEIEPESLFHITYDFKTDFGFTNFDNDDFYDFIYNRMKNNIKIYEMFMLGYSKNATDKESNFYSSVIQSSGYLDSYNDNKLFLCSFKILYDSEVNKC